MVCLENQRTYQRTNKWASLRERKHSKVTSGMFGIVNGRWEFRLSLSNIWNSNTYWLCRIRICSNFCLHSLCRKKSATVFRPYLVRTLFMNNWVINVAYILMAINSIWIYYLILRSFRRFIVVSYRMLVKTQLSFKKKSDQIETKDWCRFCSPEFFNVIKLT